MTAATPLLSVRGLAVHHGDRCALRGVDLDLTGGTTLAVIGPNGSGKTTLLRAIAGLADPAEGSVTVDRRSTAFVLQATDVDRSLPITVAETVRMARYARLGMVGRMGAADKAAVRSAMERVGVADLAAHQLHDLSGGQRQRVLVAQGLAQEADLLLLDEPVTGLDLPSRELILDAIDAERAAGRAVVATTHSLDDARRCDLVLLLAGAPVAFGPPEQVIEESLLREAFGGRVLGLADGGVLLDDPHHTH